MLTGFELCRQFAAMRGVPGCLLWPRGRGANGYGVVSVRRRPTVAHRVVCELAHGDPPSLAHRWVLHTCTSQICVNPDHLYWSDSPNDNLHRDTSEALCRVIAIADERGCIEWPRGRNRAGYGIAHFAGQRVPAHRVVCILAHGQPPSARPFVLHSCDNPSCVNPHHLRWGDAKENSNDMVIRGRRPRIEGSKHGRSKLTESDILDIRNLHAMWRPPHQAIADAWGVHRVLISCILLRKIWRHI
jgi:hypothetical protein